MKCAPWYLVDLGVRLSVLSLDERHGHALQQLSTQLTALRTDLREAVSTRRRRRVGESRVRPADLTGQQEFGVSPFLTPPQPVAEPPMEPQPVEQHLSA